MLLAGDVGGTKILLGLFERGRRRPSPVAVRSYDTSAFAAFTEVLDTFAHEVRQPVRVDAAALGVAGPVVGDAATVTRTGWTVRAGDVAARLSVPRVRVLNDLEALAEGVDRLADDELAVLQPGAARGGGNAAVIAAGTGLGEAQLVRVGRRWRAAPSEGGHADFAARTDRELELVRMLRDEHGRVEVERVVSGPGLVNLHRFTHRGGECPIVGGADGHDAPARISRAGLGGRCQGCADALRMFVSAFGAEAGNLALRALATAGVYVGGGIAPKILPALTSGVFMDAFLDKAPMTALLADVPVKVILNPEAGLIGAAIVAAGRRRRAHA
jgi:glucokinase